MIKLDGHKLNLDDIRKSVLGGDKCDIAPNARAAMQRSRALVEQLAGEERAIYGINTGFGPLSGQRVSTSDLEQHQINLLHHLSVGQGDLFSPVETKSIMVARANALARGYSGIREEVVDLLLASFNNNILPEIPSEGSVGASGDLVPLAHMSRLLIGLGHARVDGDRLTAVDALKSKNLSPVTLKCKEGLALVNGTSVMTGLMALATIEASQILRWMEFLTACLIQSLYGAPEVLCSQLHMARGHRGQYTTADYIASYLKSHPDYKKEIDDHEWGSHKKPVEEGTEIQDPYSLRCTPQILGAFQDAYWHVEQVVTRELNASTDNPLIFPATETVIHGGNFYGQHIAMVSDYLRIGLIKLALLSERQTERLLNWRYSMGLSPLLTGGAPGLNSGMMGCQLLATSLAAEARLLGTAASIQTIPTNANNQDVVSMGTTAAKMTRKVLPILWKLLAIETMAIIQAADLRDDKNMMGKDYRKFYDIVRNITPKLENDRPLFEDIEKVVTLLQSRETQKELLRDDPTNPLTID
jgi:histidine ammonia-lyase